MNYLDIAVIVILLIFMFNGRSKGFFRTCLSFVPTVGSVFITGKIYPYISNFLKGTWVYSSLKEGVIETLSLENFDNVIDNSISEINALENINIPSILKTSIIENNNPVVYDLLEVENFSDYVASFVASSCLNILCMIIIFIVTFLLIVALLNTLDLVSKLPVLNFCNKTLGLAAGLIQGIIFLWFLCLIGIFLYSNPSFNNFFIVLEQSKIAKLFFENNLLLLMGIKIIV